MQFMESWLGSSSYYIETIEKICSVVNELERDRTGSGFCTVLGFVISYVESFDPPVGMFVTHVC
jgi:hypothetical protein